MNKSVYSLTIIFVLLYFLNRYICLPWKRGVVVESVAKYLNDLKRRHEEIVQWYQEELYEYGTMCVSGPLENVKPDAPTLLHSFDLSKVLERIEWIKHDAGRQLLTGSFHPVDDALWDNNVRLSPGKHTFVQIVLESIDYPDDTSGDLKCASSLYVRESIVNIFFAPQLTGYAGEQWYVQNVKVGWNPPCNMPPAWWESRLVLIAAATPSQVKELKEELLCSPARLYEQLSYNPFTIEVGESIQAGISLARTMAQPALNRCVHCGLELLIPNRCGGCQQVSFCNKKCQVAGWKIHRKVCAGSKKKRKNNKKGTPIK
jgi:hypothetical protein